MRDPKTILITGASSGIGAALATLYAAPGVTLALLGRNAARLEPVAAACRGQGAIVELGLVDAADREGMAAWIGGFDSHHPVDLAIANAGIAAQQGGRNLDAARALLIANVEGVYNTVEPLLGPMAARRRGQLALMSSLASFVGYPGGAGYGASKAAVRLFGEGMRATVWKQGIHVSVICPGFIDTPMTDAVGGPQPFKIGVDRAARIIRRGLAADKARVIFPWQLAGLTLLGAMLPAGLVGWGMRQGAK